MKKVLITGATGNVGIEVLSALQVLNPQLDIYAGVRNVAADSKKLEQFHVKCVPFDFENQNSIANALEGCEMLFLLRPPQIAEVEKVFKPIIEVCKQKGVKHIVFLSVQGVEKSKIIPHHQIEQLIVDSKIPYTFLRPAYFMQNFTTMLRNDLVNHQLIYLPAGKARFTLIDLKDVGSVSAAVLSDSSHHINQAYDLTCNEKLTFGEMAALLTQQLGVKIRFQSPYLISFFLKKRKEGNPVMYILVLIMLHYLPRFQQEPTMTYWVAKITDHEPTDFKTFIEQNRKLLLS